VLGLVAQQVLVRRFERVGQEGLARLLFAITVVQAAAVLLFALSGSLAFAVAGMWAYYLTRNTASPIYTTWLNQNITESSVRATVISISNQSDAIGQVAGGPALGGGGHRVGVTPGTRRGRLAAVARPGPLRRRNQASQPRAGARRPTRRGGRLSGASVYGRGKCHPFEEFAST
jgi:predicted MFS family arabinose efflux permease